MQGQPSAFKKIISVKLLTACLTILAPFHFDSLNITSTAYAQSEEDIPKGWESYLDRPSILSLKPEAKDLGINWNALKAVHFSFIAELLVLYPKDTHIYFFGSRFRAFV